MLNAAQTFYEGLIKAKVSADRLAQVKRANPPVVHPSLQLLETRTVIDRLGAKREIRHCTHRAGLIFRDKASWAQGKIELRAAARTERAVVKEALADHEGRLELIASQALSTSTPKEVGP